jgi:uncharacterized membrane protein
MTLRIPLSIFVLTEIIIISFILTTVGVLPDNIASHFDATGMPNGFMSKTGYTIFILAFVVGIPSMVVLLMHSILYLSYDNINIPNREYWLSEQNRIGTVQFLKNHVAYLAVFIVTFMGYVHWLLLKANSVQPPKMPNTLLFIGIGVFIVGMLILCFWLLVKFMRIPH